MTTTPLTAEECERIYNAAYESGVMLPPERRRLNGLLAVARAAEERGRQAGREDIYEALQSCRAIDALAATWGGNGDAMAALVGVIRAIQDDGPTTAHPTTTKGER